jgi:hypothetical protein
MVCFINSRLNPRNSYPLHISQLPLHNNPICLYNRPHSIRLNMEYGLSIKFNSYVKGLLAFLRSSMPMHKDLLDESEKNIELANIIKPRKLKDMFDEYIRIPYGNRIRACDATLINELDEKDQDVLKLCQIWNSPEFDDMKKAQVFQYLIQICDNCY